MSGTLQSHHGDLRESAGDDAETVYLEVGTDCDTSDEENAEFTHRLFDKVPDHVRVVVRRRKRKSAKDEVPTLFDVRTGEHGARGSEEDESYNDEEMDGHGKIGGMLWEMKRHQYAELERNGKQL